MSAVFDAYNLHTDGLVEFYRRLNRVIAYPDGMTTSLGIVYWGRDEHLGEVEKAIPRLVAHGLHRFQDVWEAARTPARSRNLSERAGISKELLRILEHDIELWLPKPVALAEIEWFEHNPACLHALSRIGLDDQLAVISAGQTPSRREKVSLQAGLDGATTAEAVKVCDLFRTGRNLRHIRAQIYYRMGMDTWQKWAEQTSEAIISLFASYIQDSPLEGQRLIPWPKEVRNGIEWAKRHLEVFAVQW
ncbi:MAG TPA: hypothetical protein PKO09_10425 [Anaerolineae bacterium]|nr:hypothetical protein [Anaerolineae bacterium]